MSPKTFPHRAIWIVDDSPTDTERVRKVLSDEYAVECISDAGTALERLSAGSAPDLLLLDWVMPGISGIEVCRYLRGMSGRVSTIPIVLLTSRTSSEEVIEAFNNGASDYICKPFVDEELKARVAALLNSSKLVEAAERAQADVRALLETAPDPIFSINGEGNVCFANAEAHKALGFSDESVIGKPIERLIPAFAAFQIRLPDAESPTSLPDLEIGEKTYSPSLRALQSEGVASTTITLRDVTARRRADARRLDFYSIIAHDLRAPISTTLLRLQAAQFGKFGPVSDALVRELAKMESSLRGQLNLINDFLEIARFEGVGYQIVREVVDLNELLLATVENFRPLAENNDQALTFVVPSTETIVLGDRQRLTQVFSNLLSNAIKFTPRGGRISISVEASHDQLEISVEDTGPGIAHQELKNIFKRFVRSRDTNVAVAGTGLGLMIVREIIEAHSGAVGVESQLGRGSRFWIRLPSSGTLSHLSVLPQHTQSSEAR